MGRLIAYRLPAHHRVRGSGQICRTALYAMAGGLLLLLVGTGLSGCSTLGFYQQAVTGQVRLLAARRDIDKVLARQDLEPRLRVALEDSKAVLAYARDTLGLEVGGRYGDYVALDREFVVWNLVVTPRDSVQPRTWCFPVAGCVSYRGYFSQARAQANAARFDASKFDTWVGGVPAYSTLGWFDDPLLSSFIFWPQAARAELLLHELAHGELYVGGDTEFNESFATFVANQALPDYLAGRKELDLLTSSDDAEAVAGTLEQHQRLRMQRSRFNSLLLALRGQLEADFVNIESLPEPERYATAQRFTRQRHDEARACLAKVADEFPDPRWAKYFASEPNLARLSLVGAYQRWVNAFRQLYDQSGQDFERFYLAAAELGELDVDERERRLQALESKALEEQIKTKGDSYHTQDIECEAFANHMADRDKPG